MVFIAFLLLPCLAFNSAQPSTQSINQTTINNQITTTSDNLSPYQDVLDKLNDEYNYSMFFSPDLSCDDICDSPLNYSLEEYESTLRELIEFDIKVNQESLKQIESIGDVEWSPVPFSGKTYYVPVNLSYPNARLLEGEEIVETPSIGTSPNNRDVLKTVSAIQPRLDPTNKIAFLIDCTISTANTWKYSTVNSFSYMYVTTNTDFPYYVPTSMSITYMDSRRSAGATFSCYIIGPGFTIINSNATVYKEYYTSGDYWTNSPNYTIPTTYTNQSYNLVGYTIAQNCAGYAWNYNDFVDINKLGITLNEIQACSSTSQLLALVKNKSEYYMSQHSIVASTISSYNSTINPANQYRVVLKVGYVDTNGNNIMDFDYSSPNPSYVPDEWDYHWWIQLGDGSWADKRGSLPSRILPNTSINTDPDNVLWTMWTLGETINNSYINFYNSAPVYYKITS